MRRSWLISFDRVARSIGPPVLVERIRSGDELFGQSVITPRRRTVLLVLLGAFGLTLALVGVFGMTALLRHSSDRRNRRADGVWRTAKPGGPENRVAMPPSRLVLGTIVGVVGATFATRVISEFSLPDGPDRSGDIRGGGRDAHRHGRHRRRHPCGACRASRPGVLPAIRVTDGLSALSNLRNR